MDQTKKNLMVPDHNYTVNVAKHPTYIIPAKPWFLSPNGGAVLLLFFLLLNRIFSFDYSNVSM